MDVRPFPHPLTRILARSVRPLTRAKGHSYYVNGNVVRIDGNATHVDAAVRGSTEYRVTIDRESDDTLVASCECRYFRDRDDICKHIWAALLEAETRGLLAGSGPLARHAIIDPIDTGSDPEFGRPAAKPEPPPRPRAWEQFLRDLSRRVERADALAEPPRYRDAQIIYVIDRASTLRGEGVSLDIRFRQLKKNGQWGKPQTAAVSPSEAARLPDPVDREILSLLLGAPDYYSGGSLMARTVFRLTGPLLDRLLPAIVQTGRAYLRTGRDASDQLVPLAWDAGGAWTFRLEAVHASRDEGFSIDGALVRGSDRMAIREPLMALASGYVFHGGTVAPLDPRGAFAWLLQLRASGPLVIPPDATGLLVDVLARSGVDPLELPEELQFEISAGSPRPCVDVRTAHYSALLLADIWFDYDGVRVRPDTGATAYDAGRRRLVRRDLAAEQRAATRAGQLGFSRQWDYTASRQTHAIGSDRFGAAVRVLLQEGWRVEAEGRVFRTARSTRSEIRSGIDWFELHGTVDFGDGQTVALPRLLQALRQGQSMITLDDGTNGIVPEEWLRRWAGIAGIGEAEGDHVRFRLSQAALLDAALAEQPAIRVDERFARTRDELASFAGITAVDAAPSFNGELRDYQRDALGWFMFLRRFGFGGCLADDMGLGKTVMVLAWLDRLRAKRETKAPSLVVVPRSVVFNWHEEAVRFAPALRVLDFSGAARSVDHGTFDGHDIVLTTYGTLRRDATRLKDVEFEYAILDEAQAIKNAATAGAKAARLIRARHRLALSGTPIENHLGELWSVFEFLNPGLLGTSSAFAKHSVAAARRDPGAMAQLARGLRPFILRRTKAQVAPELPSRTELSIRCELQGAQRELYDELRDHYRASLLGRIAREGLQKSKMQILEALLRLRQAACHPALIDRRRGGSSSAKFDALLPRLAELREEGHKSLVFSQFTSLLALLRAELDEAGVPYEYLDGKTRDREPRVHRFQNDPRCGLFLISLKAGGLGLNLTAAEYVFLLDPWWNPAVEAQAIDRAHRIGQTRHVFAYRLLAAGTVEDKIAELQRTKRHLADAILQADAGLLRDLKREDVEVLLS